MMPLARRAFARALFMLATVLVAAPASAQFGFTAPSGPAVKPCTPFSSFPLSVDLGLSFDGRDGESSRCGFGKIQNAINTLAGQRAQPNGIATLDSNGLVPLSQIPATVALNTAVNGKFNVADLSTPIPTASYASLNFKNSTLDAIDILGPQQPPGYFTVDGVRSTIRVPSELAATTVSAFGFYVRNEAPESKTGATGMFGTTACVVANSACWGQNPTVIDAPQNGVVTNLQGIKLIGAEYDIQVTSPYTTVQGIGVIGTSMAQPANADGITVGHLGVQAPGKFKWTHSFVTTDGSSNIAYLSGAADASGANVNGQPSYFNYIDSAGTTRAVRTQALADGSFYINGVSNPNGIKFQTSIAGQYPSIRPEGTDANIALVLVGKGTGPIIMQSPTVFQSPAQDPVYNAAGLPACTTATRGSRAFVIDATAPSYGAPYVGGGNVSAPVTCRGDNWYTY